MLVGNSLEVDVEEDAREKQEQQAAQEALR